jgi:hypothetical protein
MACLSGNGQGDKFPPDDVRRWTENLSNVLQDPKGRSILIKFLQKRGLKDEEEVLDFWIEYQPFLINQR